MANAVFRLPGNRVASYGCRAGSFLRLPGAHPPWLQGDALMFQP
jgi:hypothetical protein